MRSESVIAISAGVIALASLFVSIWSARVTRKHNRLSVAPHLRVDYFDRLKEGVEVVLKNNGLGTAIIRRFAVRLDGIPVPTSNSSSVGEALMSTGVVDKVYAFVPTVDDALSAGEQILLFSFLPENHQSKKIQPSLARITFNIDYESMYGDSFRLNRNATGTAPNKSFQPDS